MSDLSSNKSPHRITDLIESIQNGEDITCNTLFEIVPVDFVHGNIAFQAYIFLCKYSGVIGSKKYIFRKCYARGCPNNLCPHVSQAVMIANRYLKRDYQKLLNAGIKLEEKIFSLEEMLVKYDTIEPKKDETTGSILTIHDYINIAKEGNKVEVAVNLEIIPAVEHFANQKTEQTFLMVDFNIKTLGRDSQFQRCLACFQTDNEAKEKPVATNIANDRLKLLFQEFDDAKVQYKPVFFN
ncbi:hypothetical protein [Desulfobacula sp.]|uniref:hypothetical protein n=1 Tax=Desulfobacula sp. TaxID=2593537 RepID=UPI0025C19BD2|nr:hypothetical protein [Desulfobacula sp.]MBC2704463.1 hypothetical protein [Desulfobacula sp.]